MNKRSRQHFSYGELPQFFKLMSIRPQEKQINFQTTRKFSGENAIWAKCPERQYLTSVDTIKDVFLINNISFITKRL